MMNDALGYYALLNVKPDADLSIIKKQYYEKAKFWHPDHNEDENALTLFQKVSSAYEILSNAQTRLQYDMLSMVYNQKDFPLIGSLKIYKNQAGKDDFALRVLKQKKVKSNFKACIVNNTKDICNIREAGALVLSTSINNWLFGWWSKDGIKKTLNAIKFNLNAVKSNDNDNLKLLIHNALAYKQEGNIEMAWIYAKQAEHQMADNEKARLLIERYIEQLNYVPQKRISIPYWNFNELKIRQLLFPFVLGIGAVLALMILFMHKTGNSNAYNKSDGYYQSIMVNGQIVPSDMVENHIIKTDNDIRSSRYLMHFNKDATVYHGPDKRYSPLKTAIAGQTVRVIGYTYNQAWYKIIFDDGETGYAHKNDLTKGIGNQIPENSKVYKGY